MDDYILRVTAANGAIRAFFATTKNMAGKSAQIHGTTPVVTAALGRLLTASAIMGLTLKNEKDLLTLRIKGDGPVGGLLATADYSANVKGYANNPLADIENKPNGKLNVSGVIGSGTLNIVKDLGLKEPYSGQVELVSGEIAEDIAYYYAKSEQTPSVVSLGVLVDRDYSVRQAGGFFIQLMPDAGDDIITELEQVIENLPSITSMLDGGDTPYNIAERLLGGFGYEILDKKEVQYYCNCSKERVERVLRSLQKSELEKIIEEDGEASVSCHFCNSVYSFDKTALMVLKGE